MILIDDRVGSKDLFPFLTDCAELTRLEFGDCCWIGNGEDENGEEEIITVGVERKNVNDLINSIDTGRLSGHQLEGLLRSYQVCYLVIEGNFRSGDDGNLECYRRGNWQTETRTGGKPRHYGEISNFINTLAIVCNMQIRQTNSPKETAHLVRWLYNWWQKPYHSHNAHKAIYSTQVSGKRKKSKGQVVVPMSQQQQVIMRVLAQIPGIEQRARLMAPRFSCLMEAAVMTEKEWCGFEGVGRITAKRLVEVFQGPFNAKR